MSFLKKKNMSLFLTFFNLIASFIMCMTIIILHVKSTAWISVNRDVGGNGSSVRAESEGIECDFFVYAYDLSLQEARSTSFVKNSNTGEYEEKANTLSDFDFNTHDAIFTELNEYTMALVQIDITGSKLIENESGTIYLTISRNESTQVSNEIKRFASNVLTFRFFGVSDDINNVRAIEGSTVINEKWKMAKSLIKNNQSFSEKQFISKTGSSYTVSESIVFTLNYVPSDIKIIDNTKTITVF